MCVDVLPNCKSKEKYKAQNEHHDNFGGPPTTGWPLPLILLAARRKRREWTHVKAAENIAIPITVNTVPK
jgi:hypothetical protein